MGTAGPGKARILTTVHSLRSASVRPSQSNGIHQVQVCREAVESDSDVLALLAKLEPSQLTAAFSELPGGAGGRGGQNELVVSDGVEVLLPMAGEIKVARCGG